MKRITAGMLAAFLLLSLTGCVGSHTIEKEEATYPVAIGNVTVQGRPERVATLSAQLTNILEDLGYGDRLVAVAADEITEEDTGRRGIGTAMAPDLEAIKEAAPDLLFTGMPMAKSQLDELSEAGIQVAVLPAIDSLDALYQRYYDVIAAMEGKAEADTVGTARIDAMKADVEQITGKIPQEKKSFLFVCTIDPHIATPDTFEAALLSLIGTNMAEGEGYTVPNEALLAAQPDVLLYAAPLQAENIRQSADFAGKNAVMENALYEVDRDALNSGTEAVLDQLRKVAGLMYPEIDFSDTESLPSDPSSELSEAAP